MFLGTNFIFDEIPSEFFNLYLGENNGSGESSSQGSSSVEPYLQEVYRRPSPYLFGVQQKPVLSFQLSAFVPNHLTAPDFEAVNKWLFGHMQYKKLRIVQEDMTYIYFNCVLKNPQFERAGNYLRGFSCTVDCDSPWGWSFPKTETFSFGDAYYTSTQVIINNVSENNFYTYPLINIEMNIFGGTASIINESDLNRQFLFTGLSSVETIVIDNDRQIIDSDSGARLSDFNKNWMRLKPGKNILDISGNISEISFVYSPARKVG